MVSNRRHDYLSLPVKKRCHAAAAAVAVKAIKGCCCCCDDGDFEYECCCGDCEDDPDYMDAPVGDHCCEASEENGASEEEENSEE